MVSQGTEVQVIKGDVDSAHSHAPNREEAQAEIVKANLKHIADEHPELNPAQILRMITQSPFQ